MPGLDALLRLRMHQSFQKEWVTPDTRQCLSASLTVLTSAGAVECPLPSLHGCPHAEKFPWQWGQVGFEKCRVKLHLREPPRGLLCASRGQDNPHPRHLFHLGQAGCLLTGEGHLSLARLWVKLLEVVLRPTGSSWRERKDSLILSKAGRRFPL